jgi:uncharacterized protein (TIGR02996 family)
MLAQAGEETPRLVYADWLEERGDPRAEFLRMDPTLERISYVVWLEKDGYLDQYLKDCPPVKREARQRQATDAVRKQRRALGATLDPQWVAFINTLGCPFRPFYFFNNHGNPREMAAKELPFTEPIGTRGAVLTFKSDFREAASWAPELPADLRFLCQLNLDECAYGAASCPLHPFICELKTDKPKRRPLTGAEVLAALRPRNFQSEHLETLEADSIPHPGYHPGTRNDEIHDDAVAQYLFSHPDHDRPRPRRRRVRAEPVDPIHRQLRDFVAQGQLWYVLLHTTPFTEEDFPFSRYVILFAVGESPQGKRLVGVVTHQVCHNLCD